jgi:hypothetical protein
VKAKRITSIVLLLFVATSVGYLVVGELTGGGADRPSDTASDSTNNADGVQAGGEGNHVIAYYFHGHKRCNTCRTIEAYAAEAIETGFPEEVQSGEIVWNVVNVEEPGNEHYLEDYELANKTVVLVEVRDGRETKWQQLNKVWQLTLDKPAFIDYVQESTRDFMGN